MRETLQHDLDQLINTALDMLEKVRENLSLAGRALLEGKGELLNEVKAGDERIDEIEHALEMDCLRVIARYQPVAVDLRMVATILKSATDLERMGDYAVHVAEDAAILAQDSPLKKYINLGSMLRNLDAMLVKLKQAVQNRDIDLARQAHKMDDEVDDLYEQIQRELVTYMIEDPRTISKSMTLLRVGRSLERFGDHIENIAERLEYWVTGIRFGEKG
jgi:phosphate transport system protein